MDWETFKELIPRDKYDWIELFDNIIGGALLFTILGAFTYFVFLIG